MYGRLWWAQVPTKGVCAGLLGRAKQLSKVVARLPDVRL